jgi:hypothetical protein
MNKKEFEEISIQIHRPHLFQAFLAEYIYSDSTLLTSKLLDLSSENYLKKTLYLFILTYSLYLNEFVSERVNEDQRTEGQQKSHKKTAHKISDGTFIFK